MLGHRGGRLNKEIRKFAPPSGIPAAMAHQLPTKHRVAKKGIDIPLPPASALI